MGLDHVHLENFRAKQAASLVLGSRLTLPMGESSSGKTTVLDAINAAPASAARQPAIAADDCPVSRGGLAQPPGAG